MKTLLIMRHAKASWDNPDWSDFERPLSQQGLKTAPFMGNIIYRNGFQPNLIISSPAKRAKQTAILVRATAEIEPKIEFIEKIYEANPITLEQVVSDFNDKYQSVLLIGHNPSIEFLIRTLTGETQLMPSASIAKIALNIETWRDLSENCGSLELVIRPKDLMETVQIQEPAFH
jgi:phosphohistidine phosphatase